MERKITKKEHCVVEVDVTFTSEEWKAAQKKAFDKAAKTIKIPGFRDASKAPEKMIKDRIDPARLMNDSINNLLPDAYKAIVMEDKIEVYAQPVIDVTECTDDKLVVKFTITTAPIVELGAYTGLEIGKEEVKVEDKEVEAAIKRMQEDKAVLVLKDKDAEAKEGDTAIIDFLGKVDGVAFEGGEAQNYELALGSHSFIPGFEEQIVGHKSGDVFTINVKFPENYVENLKGKDATFDITLHEIKEKKLPEVTEDFIKEINIPNVKTVDELKAFQKNNIKQNKENNARRNYVGKLLEAIAKNSKIEIADAVIEEEIKGRKAKMEENLKQQGGFTLEQYLQVTGKKMEDFEAELKADAERAVKDQAIIEAIIAKEKIEVTEKDLDFEFAKLADQYGMKIEDVKKALQGREGQYMMQIRYQRAEDLIFNKNN